MSLSEGEHQVKVMFYISTKGATVTIKSIDVVNAENQTNNIGCESCPPAHFINVSGSSVCQPCPIGYTSHESRTKCVECDNGFYTPFLGSECHRCPVNTFASSDKSKCIPESHIIGVSSVDTRPLLYHSQFFST